MRRPVMVILLAAAVLTALLPMSPRAAVAQQAAAPPAADPLLRIDPAQLPPLPPIIPGAQRDQMVLISTGVGAAIGIIAADIVTGGLLLSPLGIPGATALFTLGGGGAAAAAAPTYSIAQRVLAGFATMAAALGGGYVGAYVAKSRPDFIRMGD